MKKSLALVLLLLVSVVALGAQAQGWREFTSPEGFFSVEVPDAPVRETKTQTDPNAGEFTTNLYISRAPGEVYVFGWVDYDPKFKFGVQAELEANRDKFVAAMKAKLLETTKISLGTHPGIEFTAELPNARIKSRVYVVGRRPYQLIAVTSPGGNSAPNVERFLKSFTLSPATERPRRATLP